MRRRTPERIVALLAILSLFVYQRPSQAHSVAQVQTAKRIARSTVVLLDPQGNPGGGGAGTDTVLQVGDIITFIFQFTPVPNNATRGAGGYITEYVPPNTEVVGARIIDRDGNTVAPHRGPQMDEGWGPRGNRNYGSVGLQPGSMSQVYADTGIFFSTDPRTVRNPASQFLSVLNGIQVIGGTTGAGQLDNFLGFVGPPFYGHNLWDVIQAYAFGGGNAPAGYVQLTGTGHTPYGYGSAVAGPQTHYAYETVENPNCQNGIDDDGDGLIDWGTGGGNDPGCASELDDDETVATSAPVGPWQRIKYGGSEIGRGNATSCQNCCNTATPPATCEGQTGPVRVGIPTDLGWDLSADNPLPPGTNAVRYAVGELIVGEEYFAEISLRVTALPLDPNFPGDVNCSEVFGGDAAQPQNGQDNVWRYFVPSPACVVLNNFFELSVDKLVAAPGETLTYKIEGKNLSVNDQTNVVVTATFVPGDVDVGTLQIVTGPAPTVGASTLTWNLGTLTPGEEYVLEYRMDVSGGGLSTLHKANYVSTALPSPGFTVVALTDIETIVVGALDMTVTPTSTTAGSTVRYIATLTNNGTGAATFNGASFLRVTLPNELSYCGAPTCTAPTVRTFDTGGVPTGGGNTTNPTIVNGTGVRFLTFTNFAGATTIVPRGGRLELELSATVAAGAAGLFQGDFQTQIRDNGIGRDVENFRPDLADLLVDIARSATPTLDAPVIEGATTVTGNTSEGPGATIVVRVNGVARPAVLSGLGGDFSVTVPTLYPGQGISATAQAPGEVVSLPSAEIFVEGTGNTITFCNDGLDNDGDGLIDTSDPGCTNALDPDETDVPACADGVDNDSDGDIDFPADQSCSTYIDDDESGMPACQDGADNDGDALTDFPADPGCSAANDVSEADLPQCGNGVDDDLDTEVDYPFDPGCSSASDDDEGDDPGAPDAGVVDASLVDASENPGGADAGDPPDPGGFDEPGDGGGCCGVGGGAPGSGLLVLFCAIILGRRRRRRR